MANSPKYHKVNRLADIIVATTLLVLAAVASIVLTSSYRKLCRSALKNGSTLSVIPATKEYAPVLEKPAETAQTVEATQVTVEESRLTPDSIPNEPVVTLTNVHEKPSDTLFSIEQPAPIVVAEATQQAASAEESKATPKITRGARRKKTTSHTRSTSRSRKKVSKAQPSTESQPPS